MNIEQKRLKNGTEVLFIDLPGSSMGCVQTWFRAGSSQEEEENLGIAHFLEHMFFKGTKNRPDGKIAKEVESFGGEINAFTSFDYTCYYINCPSHYLCDSTDILMDMIANPLFKDDEIAPERGVVFEEYLRGQDNPAQFNFYQIQSHFFQGPYRDSIIGTEKTIKSFTKGQLIEFRNRFYNKENFLLVIAGDLNSHHHTNKEKSTLQELCNIVERHNLPKGEKSILHKFNILENGKLEIHEKDVKMASLTMVIQAHPFSHDIAPAEELAMNCLGHGETSYLYHSLVQSNQDANHVSASTMYVNDGGVHFIRISFPVERHAEISRKILHTFEDLLKKRIEGKDLVKIKNQYIASKIYEKESLESFAFSLGHGFAQSGDIFIDQEFIEKIKKQSIFSTNDALSNVLSRSMQLTVQLPLEDNFPGKNKTEKKRSRASLLKSMQKLKEGLPKLKKINPSLSKGLKASPSKFDPTVKIIDLKEGVQLIYRQNTMTPSFVLHGYIQGGLIEENPNNNGIYNLLCGNLTKGYEIPRQKKIDYNSLQHDLESKSASLSGFSGKNAYGLTLHGLSDYAEELFRHFFGSFLFPTFPADQFKIERDLALRAVESRKHDPAKQCFKKVSDVLFKGHPYSLDILGTQASIKKLKVSNAKENHQGKLKNSKILFTYCGDLGLETVIGLLHPYLETLKPRKPKKINWPKASVKAKGKYFIPFDREQTHIYMGRPGPLMSQKDDFILKILSSHLGGMSSELFMEVRDRMGLCYSVQPVHFSAISGGHWGIYIASSTDKSSKAISSVKAILKKIQLNGLSAQELNEVKRMIQGQLELGLQTNDDYANFYSIPSLQGPGLDFQHNKLAAIKNLKLDEVNVFLKKFLSGEFITVAVGNKNPFE